MIHGITGPLDTYQAGCVLAVPVTTDVGIISHKGIMGNYLGPDGLPTVIHNAKLFGQIIETSLTDFCLMSTAPVTSEGYPGILPAAEVLTRARSQITKPWRLWHNCEHFSAWCHGLPVRSPQLRAKAKKAGTIAGAIVGVLVLGRLGR